MSWTKIIILLIAMIPMIMLVQSASNVKSGLKEKVNWKMPVLIYIILSLVALVVHIYLLNVYELSIFSNSYYLKVGILVDFLLFGLIAVINIVVSIIYRNAPKSVHDGKKVWKFIGTGFSILLLILVWFLPLANKIVYVIDINSAIENSQATEDRDFSLVLVRSQGNCFNDNNCADEHFNNVFYIKNNTEETKKIQTTIKTFTESEEEMETIISDKVTLEPGQLKMVETKETSDADNEWNKYSFETDNAIVKYSYKSLEVQ